MKLLKVLTSVVFVASMFGCGNHNTLLTIGDVMWEDGQQAYSISGYVGATFMVAGQKCSNHNGYYILREYVNTETNTAHLVIRCK